MKQLQLPITELKCKKSAYNKLEVELIKRVFLKRKPIPSPCINKKKEVIAFYSCYFALKELKVSPIWVMMQ